MGILLDLIFVLIVLLCIYLSVKKGFIRSLIEVVGCVLAIVIALSLGSVVANYIYESSVEPAAISAVENIIKSESNDAIDSLPSYIKAFFDATNIDIEALIGSGDAATQIVSKIEPTAIGAIKAVSAFVIFLLLMIIVKILAKVLNSLFQGIVLGTANKVLGGVFGAVKGLIFAAVFCMIVYFIASVTANDFLFFSDEAIKSSIISEKVINLLLGKI